jgi:hypothetical protein
VKLAALVLAALALAACESNQERSAALKKAHHGQEVEEAKRRALAQRALTITRQSTRVKVVATAVVHGSEGDAAIVTLHNTSGKALSNVPIEITVRSASGASLYTNAIPGLSATLASIALIPAHSVQTWIDDQVQATGTPASVSAKVGEGTPVKGAIPQLSVVGAHLAEATEAEGNLVNRSALAQSELVVDAVARRAGKIIAAGRAVLASAPAGTTTPFQIFFVGAPAGAQLEVSAPATAPG